MIFGRVTGDGPVLLRLRSMSIGMRTNLRRAIKESAILLTRYVKENKLSGQVLKNRTGTLRRKVNYRVSESETSITGAVGVKLSYAAPHEYGFDGIVTVRQHLRRAKGDGGRDERGRFRSKTGGSIVVRAHQRHMHLPQRSFLRSSLRENAPAIRSRLRNAVLAATQ